MEIEKQVQQNTTEIFEIRKECELHRTSTRDVLNEVLCIKDAIKKLKADFVEIRDVKKAVESIRYLILQQGSRSVRGRPSVRWMMIGVMSMIIFWLSLSIAEGRFLLF